jgi:hypothetical protein
LREGAPAIATFTGVWLRILSVVLVASAAACYSPRIRNLGYSCDPHDANGCPSGFRCINGFCDDGTGTHPPSRPDLAMSVDVDMARSPTGTTEDLSQPSTTQDLAEPSMTQDLAQPVTTQDMRTSCVPNGSGPCKQDHTVCCSRWCDYPSNTCQP